jgi:DNA-binding protein H-NS
MSEYKKIQAQIAQLQLRAAELKDAEKRDAIRTINELVAALDISATEIVFGDSMNVGNLKRRTRVVHANAGRTLLPRYKDDAGNTWTGRGLKPKWLQQALQVGKKLESFKISP